MPLFTGGLNRAKLAAAHAAYNETVADYRQTVLSAFGEVADDLAAQLLLAREWNAENEAVTAARRALEIANNRYQAGLVTYLEVATAQTERFEPGAERRSTAGRAPDDFSQSDQSPRLRLAGNEWNSPFQGGGKIIRLQRSNRLPDQFFAHTLSPHHPADFFGEDKFDFAGADFFVELHRGEKFLALRGIQFDLHRQAGTGNRFFNPLSVARRQAENFLRQFCRRDLADGNRLAVQKFSVAGTVFNRVADGVAEIQNRAQAAFRFVLADDFRLDFAAARDDGGERLGVALEQLRQIAFELREQLCVVNTRTSS